MIIRGGLFGDKAETLPIIKLQNIEISQSPYQRRKKLANVKIHTAAGNVTIPYVGYNRAIQLSDYILYKTESSNKRWM
jgi:putative membrane protein